MPKTETPGTVDRVHLSTDPVDVVDLLGMNFPETHDPVARVIVQPGVTLLRADPFDAGILALNLAVARSTETSWLKWRVWPGRTLYVDALTPAPQVAWRLRRMRREVQRPLPREALTVVTDRGLKLDTPDGRARIERHLDATGADCLILNPALHLRAVSMIALVAALDHLVQTRTLAILITHDLGSGLESHALNDGADRVLRLERNGDAGVWDLELRQGAKAAPFEKMPLQRTKETFWFQPFTAAASDRAGASPSTSHQPAPARAGA